MQVNLYSRFCSRIDQEQFTASDTYCGNGGRKRSLGFYNFPPEHFCLTFPRIQILWMFETLFIITINQNNSLRNWFLFTPKGRIILRGIIFIMWCFIIINNMKLYRSIYLGMGIRSIEKRDHVMKIRPIQQRVRC